MPVTMRILGWKSENLRCPDHEIDLCDSSGLPYKVTLIQMPNGTGKTTTLNLLRAALSGSASKGKWDSRKIKEFQKRESSDGYGRFEVRLALNDKRVTIIMNFNFESGTVTYKTTRGDGQVNGFDPPLDLRRFLNENFVNFFVFDGELAQSLLDPEHTNAETVVEQLFQINTLQIFGEMVGQYWDKKTRTVSAKEERGLSRRRNDLLRLARRLGQLLKEKELLEQERADIQGKLERQQKAYDQEIQKEESRSQQLESAQSKVALLESRVEREALKTLEMMADPHALSARFATAMSDLKAGLDRVKLPESAAREFFEELLEENECICGRPIDDTIRAIIRSRSSQYLGSDDVSLLNSMKTAIDDAVGRSQIRPEEELASQLQLLEEIVMEERTARNELAYLKNEAEQSDPAVKRAKEEIDALKLKREKTERALEKYNSDDTTQDDERTFGIGVIKRRLEEAELKLAEITRTLELKSKRDILRGILAKAYSKAKAGITDEICTEANARIRELMPYNNIRIDRIERCLLLKGQAGGSAGEQLSIAYAFLSMLFNRSEHQLPFVVDSPAGPIDLAVRPKIGELIPKLSNQFIAFTISSEREGFVPRLSRSVSSPVQYITLFRKGAVNLESEARSVALFEETCDGLTVMDEDFFNSFQLDAEEA